MFVLFITPFPSKCFSYYITISLYFPLCLCFSSHLYCLFTQSQTSCYLLPAKSTFIPVTKEHGQHHAAPNQSPKDKHYGIPLIHSYLFPNCNNADVIHIFFSALVLLIPMVLTQWRCSQMAIYNRQPILKQHDLFPCR